MSPSALFTHMLSIALQPLYQEGPPPFKSSQAHHKLHHHLTARLSETNLRATLSRWGRIFWSLPLPWNSGSLTCRDWNSEERELSLHRSVYRRAVALLYPVVAQ